LWVRKNWSGQRLEFGLGCGNPGLLSIWGGQLDTDGGEVDARRGGQ